MPHRGKRKAATPLSSGIEVKQQEEGQETVINSTLTTTKTTNSSTRNVKAKTCVTKLASEGGNDVVENQHWLLKSEPDEFSFDMLTKCPLATEAWDGVRNHQAKNFMRDQMKQGHTPLL